MTMLAPPILTSRPAVAQTPPPAPSPPAIPPGRRVLLPHISWSTYQAMLADIGDGHARLTYDNGWLEIEMPGPLHEVFKTFTARMIEKVLERQHVPFEPYAATTWRRPDLVKGLEADECYFIQSVPRIAGKIELDLTVDPPPDLAIEVEVESPLLDKAAVYAGLGVPELWRLRSDGACDFFRLDAAGQYQPIAVSVAVPPFTPAVVATYLRVRAESSHSVALARFEAEYLPTVGG